MELQEQVTILARELKSCQNLLIALGDEVRQHLILEMMRLHKYEGVRVGELAAAAKLSRSAVSHHLQILKNAGIVCMREEGTKNYYYFDAFDSCEHLIQALRQVQKIEQQVPKPPKEDFI